MTKQILELIEKGVFTTRLVTMILTGVCCYMWVSGIPLEETLRASWLIIIGFWFNSELSNQIIKLLMEERRTP